MSPKILGTMDLEQAKDKQFQLTTAIAKEFSGRAFFNQGDLGVVPGKGRPVQTEKVERVLSHFFKTENCALVRGAGTAAIRVTLSALLAPGESLFMHTSPIYKTTQETIRMMGLVPIRANYNDSEALREALVRHSECKVFYVQHSRQTLEDVYDLGSLIQLVKSIRPELPIVVDDNYTALKVPQTGVELGATYSCFSGFKLLGPPGIGIVVGDRSVIRTIHERNYSGGGQVQGYEAMELLRALVSAPVMIAVQNEQIDRLHERLNQGVIPEVKKAYITNSQSKNVIVELKTPIAQKVIEASEKYGAAVYPVGAESRFEVLPMIYRVSGSFLDANPALLKTGLRINPMRSGAELVIDILTKAIAEITHSNEGK
ncbi:hypothetical protein GCM10011391_37970 [Pullulanibacillus camelliae]|uniref:Aminotransferase class V-fold PLP-dependent enzyme n=1 Tax=Pullulanibacillus camelliae TaxID=1707096 RepID=A0A8J2YMY5_9BACL|nr:aminotransferase class V-fold PLP-dependent enzyme [Pullulanibacillus camelliae]GGE55368.1 hypothetical protein GCM10011391_37970 [Pullulanibacillus camelliae]